MLSPLLVAKSKSDLCVLPAMANRHGLITGATGTGKTVTLQTLAERFSSIVERGFIVPPSSRVGPLAEAERRKAIDGSLVAGHYEKAVDRESAYEQLKARAGEKTAGNAPAAGGFAGILDKLGIPAGGATAGRTRESPLEAAAKSAARAMGSEVGRSIIRGVLGSILGSRR